MATTFKDYILHQYGDDYYATHKLYPEWVVNLAEYLTSYYHHIESLPADPERLMDEIHHMKELKDLPVEDAAQEYFNLIHQERNYKHYEYLDF